MVFHLSKNQDGVLSSLEFQDNDIQSKLQSEWNVL